MARTDAHRAAYQRFALAQDLTWDAEIAFNRALNVDDHALADRLAPVLDWRARRENRARIAYHAVAYPIDTEGTP